MSPRGGRRPRAMLSVDFDFFVWLPQDERQITLPATAGRTLRGPAAEIFDFGYGDGRMHAELLWYMRQRSFAEHGVKLEDVVTLRPDQGTPTVAEFAETLHRRVGPTAGPIGTHDHHNEALGFLHARLGRLDHVISFDAHHDLGYRPGDAERAATHTYGVGAWLYGALREGLAERVTVVYPDWRGIGEWTAACAEGTPEWLEPLEDRITITTWSAWRAQPEAPEQVVGTFVCRSPGWSPPWCDPTFEALLDTLAAGREPAGQRPAPRHPPNALPELPAGAKRNQT